MHDFVLKYICEMVETMSPDIASQQFILWGSKVTFTEDDYAQFNNAIIQYKVKRGLPID